MNAMWRIGLGVAVVSDMEFRNEKLYQSTMSLAKKLLSDGAITEKDYHEFDTKMQQKYKPKYGRLFTDISLDKHLI